LTRECDESFDVGKDSRENEKTSPSDERATNS
jgi:hypothetical protein